MRRLLEGRGILIVSAVAVMAASFSLGFFAGKMTDKEDSVEVAGQIALKEAKEPIPHIPANSISNTASIEKAEKPDVPIKKVKEPQTSLDAGSVVTKDKAGSFSVQAGAFGDAKDAEALKERLAARGYKAYILKQDDPGGRVLYKVRAGRFDSKKEAEEAVLALKEKSGITAFVSMEQ
jgi:cell division septation protein DedD